MFRAHENAMPKWLSTRQPTDGDVMAVNHSINDRRSPCDLSNPGTSGYPSPQRSWLLEKSMSNTPNIILVHGAWGDASHWRHVIPLLHEKGFRVFAVQNPLTSLSEDIDRTSKLAAAQDVPTLLVGHAYGCAVITGAGHTENVIGLVYLAGPALDEGESLRTCKRAEHHPRGRRISVRIGTGFCGSRPRSFMRPSVTTSPIKLNRWCGLLPRNQQQSVASKSHLEHQHGE